MSMVTMVLHNLLVPVGDPMAARTALSCRMSRMTIMRVRRTLSDTEIERCGRMNLRSPHPQEWEASIAIPIAISITLAQSTAASLWRTHRRTDSGKVQKAGEGNGPGIPAVYYITAIKLDESALDTWMNWCRIKQTANQKTIS